jgi:alkylation response protein AidB-like acyl-CoA dehydrogenase
LCRAIFNADHLAFRDSVRYFVDRRVEPQLCEFIARHELTRELWLEAGLHGYLGINVPQQFRGVGTNDYRFSAVLTEELARGSAALASCLSIRYDVVAPYFVHLTTDDQKERWLSRLCGSQEPSDDGGQQ